MRDTTLEQSIPLEDTRRISWWLCFVCGCIGLGIGYLAGINYGSPELSTTIPAEETSTDDVGAAILSTNTVTVSDQSAGLTVLVENVSMAQSGWVVIRENISGIAGNILGAQLFDAGNQTGEVTLLRATVSGNSYYAELRQDNGNRMFDLDADVGVGSESARVLFHTYEKSAPLRNDFSQ